MEPTRYRPLTDQLTDSLFVYQCVDAARLAADRPTAFKAVAAILRAYQDEARQFCPTCGAGAPGWVDDPRGPAGDPAAVLPCPTCHAMAVEGR